MLIGELAKLTATNERQLRYYERVGLLTPQRHNNGYRAYAPDAVQTVRQIRTLLAAGLPTSLIRQVLPCARTDGSLRPCDGIVGKLRTQLARLDERAAELAEAQQTLRQAIAKAEAGDVLPVQVTSPAPAPAQRGTHQAG